MKSLFISIAISMLSISNVMGNEPDSVIINVGTKKKITIYGETKADLRELEKLDLNKALKKMNQEMEAMPVKTDKLIVKDYEGDTYLTEKKNAKTSFWRQFYKNTSLDAHYGLINAELLIPNVTSIVRGGGTTIDGIPQKPEVGKLETFGKMSQSKSSGLSFVHHSHLINRNKLSFSLDKGLIYDFGLLRGVVSNMTIYNPASSNNSMIKDITTMDTGNGHKDVKIVYTNGTTNDFSIAPSYIDLMTLSGLVRPTISMLDKKGKESIKLGLAVLGGYAIYQRETIKALTKQKGDVLNIEYASSNLGKTHYGFDVSLGYKMVHLFWQRLYRSDGNIKTLFDCGCIVETPGKIATTTFGIRFGR